MFKFIKVFLLANLISTVFSLIGYMIFIGLGVSITGTISFILGFSGSMVTYVVYTKKAIEELHEKQ